MFLKSKNVIDMLMERIKDHRQYSEGSYKREPFGRKKGWMLFKSYQIFHMFFISTLNILIRAVWTKHWSRQNFISIYFNLANFKLPWLELIFRLKLIYFNIGQIDKISHNRTQRWRLISIFFNPGRISKSLRFNM